MVDGHRWGVSLLGEDGTGMHILASTMAGFGIRTYNALCHSVPSTERYKTQIWLPDQLMNQIPCLSNKKTKQGKAKSKQISAGIKVHAFVTHTDKTRLDCCLVRNCRMAKERRLDDFRQPPWMPIGLLCLWLCARQTTHNARTHTHMEWRSISTRVSHRVGGLPTPYWPGLPWAFCSGLVASRDLSVVTCASFGVARR